MTGRGGPSGAHFRRRAPAHHRLLRAVAVVTTCASSATLAFLLAVQAGALPPTTIAEALRWSRVRAAVVADPNSAAPPAAGAGSVSVLMLALPGRTAADHPVYVYRPPGPDSSTLPVVYLLHGVPGAASDPFTHGVARLLDEAFARGAPPFVLASPDGRGDAHSDTEWADAADGSDRLESFVDRVVVPAVEGTHPRDAAHRAVAGLSMGGYGAMNLALRTPGLFGQVVSIAGYFHVDDPSGMFGGDSAVIAANSPDQHVDRARGLRILLVDGTGESDPVIAGESRRFAQLLDAANIPATFRLAGGDDGWDLADSAVGAVVDFVDQGFARSPGARS